MVRLTPLLESEFNAYIEKLIPDYAADKVKAGYWSEESALEKSRKSIASILPEGLHTKHHHLFKIEDGETNTRMGVVWLNARTDSPRPSGFIYDIELDEAFRGKGFGKQAMLALEQKARELGLESIGLHVFAHNKVANGLYAKLGYVVTSMNMSKDID